MVPEWCNRRRGRLISFPKQATSKSSKEPSKFTSAQFSLVQRFENVKKRTSPREGGNAYASPFTLDARVWVCSRKDKGSRHSGLLIRPIYLGNSLWIEISLVYVVWLVYLYPNMSGPDAGIYAHAAGGRRRGGGGQRRTYLLLRLLLRCWWRRRIVSQD